MHYHVLTGMEGGYMPDSNTMCESRDDARSLARELAEEMVGDFDDDDGEVTVAGGPDLLTIEIENASPTHLRTYVEVTECDEPTCQEDENGS